MSLRSPELTSKTRMNSILKPLINRISTPFSSTTNLWRHHHLAVRPLAAAAAAPEAAPAAQQQLARVVLKGGKAKLFTEHQNPIVYGGAVDRVVGRPAPKTGDPVLVCAGNEAPIAWGMYNPDSMYRVRIMQTADEVDADGLENPCVQETLDARLVQAVELRQAVGLPSTSTTVYRAVNSEGDRLSGLIVDVLGTHVVVSSSAAWVERRKSEIEATLLRRIPGAATIIWRPAAELAAEEGYGKEEGDAAEGDTESSVEVGVEGESAEPPGGLVVVENEAKFAVDPLGQKTGFYADQRDHRAFIRGIAAGREVLDVCCYSGGFALNAALGGAVSVLGSTPPALQ